MNTLKITERRKDSVTILDLSGDIRLGSGSVELRKALRGLAFRDEKNILLNLAAVTNIDSSGLGEIISSLVTMQKNKGNLKLLNLTQRVRDLMVITKLLTVFDSFKTESDALRSFQPFFKTTEAPRSLAVPV